MFDVAGFGAVGDGTADDTGAIRQAINYNFLTKGQKGYILDESKARLKIIKDNIEEPSPTPKPRSPAK